MCVTQCVCHTLGVWRGELVRVQGLRFSVTRHLEFGEENGVGFRV